MEEPERCTPKNVPSASHPRGTERPSRVSAYFFLTPVFGLLLGAALALGVIALDLWLATRG